MRKVHLTILAICVLLSCMQAQDTLTEEKTKKGFNFGILPVVGYNSDIGFQYGLVFNLFNYGEGDLYPEYKYSLYTEVSRTTRGGGINQVFFDSKYLLPRDIRITADFSYLTELALDFYGFNGYNAKYHPEFADDSHPAYKSRMFYKYARTFLRFTSDFQVRMFNDNLHWLAGIGYFDLEISGVDIDKLNRRKSEEDKLPDTDLLYDNYIDWGLIGQKEKDGGNIASLKTGFIYDSRDNEPSPNRGTWSEVLLFYAPGLSADNFSYLKLAVTHRQYFTLVKKRLVFAYRLGYQGTLAGNVPFFMQNYMINSFAKVTTTDGLGGAKTLRGILRNRVVGDALAFGNIELRWKVFKTILWDQNIYLALNGFVDGGRVVGKIDTSKRLDLSEETQAIYFNPDTESIHWSAGGGFRIGLNQNFIVAVDYGRAFDVRDGNDGLYVGIGYLF